MSFNQFQRTELLFGSEGLSLLRKSHVAVVGCGAVGGFAVEALARAGVGHLTLVDGDVVSESNINRQICATHTTLGEKKVHVLAKRIHDICPDTRVSIYPIFLKYENCDEIFSDIPDIIIDAIDEVSGKIPLILYAQKKGIQILSSMGAAMKTDFSKIRLSTLNQTSVCPLAARVRKMIKEQGGDLSLPCVFSVENPVGQHQAGRQMGSLVTITGMFGLVLANEAIKRIVGHV